MRRPVDHRVRGQIVSVSKREEIGGARRPLTLFLRQWKVLGTGSRPCRGRKALAEQTGKVTWRKSLQARSGDAHIPASLPSVAMPDSTDAASPRRFYDAVRLTGIPSVAGASTPKEDAIGLLVLAAEIEHALMVQYLYAALSLRRSDARIVVGIAIQEMGHLISIQNLLIALTGLNEHGMPASLHLGRDNHRQQSERNPLPFRLEQISHATLAKYVVIERPEAIASEELATRLNALESEAESDGAEVNPIFALYAAIRWLFQTSDEQENRQYLDSNMGFKPDWHITDDDFVKSSVIDDFASTVDEWNALPGLIVGVAHNVSEAAAIIDEITAQGEGLLGNQDSHFAKFLELLDKFEADRVRVRSRPRTPFVSGQQNVEDHLATEITNPYTIMWATLFNLRYEVLVVDIALAISQPRTNPIRKYLIQFTIDQMNQILRPIAGALTSKPLGSTLPVRAGPPYGLSDGTVPSSAEGFSYRYKSLFTQQESVVENIRNHPDFLGDILDEVLLDDIARLDQERTRHLTQGE